MGEPQAVALRKTSLVDYPGLVSAVVFFPGCNLRCPWCHNRELVTGEGAEGAGLVPLAEALAHIEKRRGVLGGVVLSGGEPTLAPGAGAVIARVKALGLRVKLDTNGTRPAVLRALFRAGETRPDYVAMDLKTAPERYALLAPNGAGLGASVTESAALIRASGIAHEFRSLALPPPWFGEEARAALLPLAGASPWFTRPFVPGNCLDPAWDTCAEGPFRG